MTDLQRVPAWYEARLGKVTASRINDVMSSGKGRETYMIQLLAERLTGEPLESFTTDAMQHGIDNEAAARAAYEARSGEFVTEVGFIQHPTILMAGASPDGLVGDDGLIEIKCPNTNTMVNYWLDENMLPTKYINQMQWQMACTGRRWNDFVAYDPRLPERLQLLVIRLHRDDTRISIMEDAVIEFLDQVDNRVKQLAGKDK